MQDERLLADVQTAIARNDLPAARSILRQMEKPPALLLAQICARLSDTDGEAEALNQLLREAPRHLQGLLAMGNLKARTGDDRAATLFFRTALNQASLTPPPAQLQAALQKAAAYVESSNKRFEVHLIESIGEAKDLPRISHALDLLTGKTQVYLQQPSLFYFPSLPQRTFYERHEFEWLNDIEAATAEMQAELAETLAGGEDFRPYVQDVEGRPSPNNPLRNDPSWGAHYFWQNGQLVAENAAKAPATIKALSQAPIPIIQDRSPMALWSLLRPDTHIQPHVGMLNTRLICHIPLVTNPDCAIRVGHETRQWVPGQALIFDDSIEHEAWNKGQHTRVILLFEIWRPEITADERLALTKLFETIDTLQPSQVGNGF